MGQNASERTRPGGLSDNIYDAPRVFLRATSCRSPPAAWRPPAWLLGIYTS